MKRYTAKLYSISKNTKPFKTKEGAEARKLLTSNIKTMKHLPRARIKRHAANLTPGDSQAVKRLRTDLKNGSYHVYGIRKLCEADVCLIKNDDKEEIAAKKSQGEPPMRAGLMAEIQKATYIMADKTNTLILDMTGNAAKSYMSVDFAKGNGYKQRCEMAAFVQQQKAKMAL